MINVAILGAGGIAKKMALTLAGMIGKGSDSVAMYAVASRSMENAQAFAKEYGFTKAFGSYEDMLQDPDVDLVYVATPHSHHYEHMKLCLAHGKHVLCEKAFTVNAKQAKEIFDTARAKGLYVAEAIWTRYLPSRTMIDELITSGVIGKPCMVTANLAYPLEHIERMCKPELAGGALLDLGVYTINFASMVLGKELVDIQATAQMLDTGVDKQDSITLTFAGGEMAILFCAMNFRSDVHGMIYGTKGYITVDNINNPMNISVVSHSDPAQSQTYPVPEQITGFEYQVQAAVDAIEKGDVECPQMPHAESVRVMQVMDDIRAKFGLVYPFE